MKIGVNLIQYTNLQGIEVCTQNLLANFKLASDDELILFVNQKSAQLFKDLNPRARLVVRNFPNLSRWRLMLFQQFGLSGELRKAKVDILFCPSLALPLLYRRKIVLVHDLAFKRFQEESKFIFRIYLSLAVWSAKYLSLKIVTISEFARQEISELLKIKEQKIEIISEGVPFLPEVSVTEQLEILKKFNLISEVNGQKVTRPYFIYVGNAYPRKNLPRLLKAFKIFTDQNLEYLLVLAGRAEQFKALQILAGELNIKDQILFTGFISDAEKVSLIKNARALCLVSLYEGFGLPILEAQKIGAPVLAARSSSLSEVAGEAAVFVNPQDEVDIAKGMEKLASDEDWRQMLIIKGYENVGKYSWASAAAKLLAVIKADN